MYSFLTFKNRFGSMIVLAATLGIATGFAVPMAMSYQSMNLYQPRSLLVPLTITPVIAAPPAQNSNSNEKDSPMARLTARNRRLEALVQTLRRRSSEQAHALKNQSRGNDEVMLRSDK